ncbi:CPBP family glutamic-type intramembrane protease [Nocardioides mangrovi]|uniref:CPBP family intramembrane metalloprotease n=1 Tax=Nocardioides mangrovi TaxID=2874580 RepID=A0ABS7UBK2_9ACTN|nr:CPBP family intramembrane glutamic endopeptidase [Nocardioides mangrovi]MBZ5738058.1 CPBP family intramembrane metalloprotease [Nocardioides mangrovi]
MIRDRRRPLVVGGFLVLGTVLLGISLHVEPGQDWFYPAALVLAATWALGGVLGGPPPLGSRSPVLPLLVGLGLGAVFVVGALVVREIPALDDLVGSVTAYAERGSGPLIGLVAVLTGVCEELFFRGALYDVVGRPVVVTTVVYTVATLATGNAMLVFAAALLGLVTAVVRERSGGVLAPAIVHGTWSLVMLLALPALF